MGTVTTGEAAYAVNKVEFLIDRIDLMSSASIQSGLLVKVSTTAKFLLKMQSLQQLMRLIVA